MSAAMRQPTSAELREEAAALVDAAEREGVTVRVLGSTGICLHCEPARGALERLGRTGKDIDLVVRGRDRKALRALLEARGYEVDHDLLVATEGTRYTFLAPASGVQLDVFVDKLEFSHTIACEERLGYHPRTLTIEDLLLGKLQVHDLTQSDLLDAIALLATHPVAVGVADDPEQVDAAYVAGLLARDWGFHHTVTANLDALDEALAGDAIDASLRAPAAAGVATLREQIDGASKSRGWKLRARVGERMQWWEDVSDPGGTY
jgi:hypothetical protein